MDGTFGTWVMVLLAGVILGGVAVLVPMAVVFSLRMVESAIGASREAVREGVGRIRTRAERRRPDFRTPPPSLSKTTRRTRA